MKGPLALVMIGLLLAGCARPIAGTGLVGPRDADPAMFFAGDVPTYAQSVTDEERAVLAYQRALRRTDPCGFATRDAMATIGEIGSVGTTFAFNECDVDVKLSGESERRIFSVNLVMAQVGDEPPAFTIGDMPVHPFYDYDCGLQMPLPLADLPAAPTLSAPARPYLQVAEVVNAYGCQFSEQLAKAIGVAMVSSPLPVRDALAAYPIEAAEHDPCEVLAEVEDVADWEVAATSPYTCGFVVRRNGAAVRMRVALQPRTAGTTDSGYVREQRDGVEIFASSVYCSAIAFVGDEMQRKLTNGTYLAMGDVATRPSVSVEVDAPHCDEAPDVAAAAARAFR